MITPIYGIDPDDPLGLSEKPKKKLTSSKELLKQGPALSPDTESTIPFVKPVRSTPVPKVKLAPRLASQMKGAELLPKPGVSPVHDLLRRTKGTVEEAMAKWDAANPGGDPVARRAFKQGIVAYASGSTGMTKNLQQAGRGKISLYDAFTKDAPAQQKARSGAEDIRFASQKASDIGAAAANIGPSPVPSGVRSGTGRFAAAALDPFQQIEATGEMIKDPASVTKMVTEPIETLADPSKSLEEKTMAGLGLGAAALPLLPPAARAIGGRIPRKAPPMDLPVPPKLSEFDLSVSDPLGLKEAPKAGKPVPQSQPNPMPGTVRNPKDTIVSPEDSPVPAIREAHTPRPDSSHPMAQGKKDGNGFTAQQKEFFLGELKVAKKARDASGVSPKSQPPIEIEIPGDGVFKVNPGAIESFEKIVSSGRGTPLQKAPNLPKPSGELNPDELLKLAGGDVDKAERFHFAGKKPSPEERTTMRGYLEQSKARVDSDLALQKKWQDAEAATSSATDEDVIANSRKYYSDYDRNRSSKDYPNAHLAPYATERDLRAKRDGFESEFAWQEWVEAGRPEKTAFRAENASEQWKVSYAAEKAAERQASGTVAHRTTVMDPPRTHIPSTVKAKKKAPPTKPLPAGIKAAKPKGAKGAKVPPPRPQQVGDIEAEVGSGWSVFKYTDEDGTLRTTHRRQRTDAETGGKSDLAAAQQRWDEMYGTNPSPPTPPKATPESPKGAKEPWEMTRENHAKAEHANTIAELQRQLDEGQFATTDVKAYGGRANSAQEQRALVQSSIDKLKKGAPDYWVEEIGVRHKANVESALTEGKPVPAEVLADYPDLAAKESGGKAGTVRVYKGWYPWDDSGKFVFDPKRQGDFPAFGGDDGGTTLHGFYTSNPEVARKFSYQPKGKPPPASARPQDVQPYPTVVSEFDYNPGRTLTIDAAGRKAGDIQFGAEGKAFRDAVRSGKYDTILLKGTPDEGDVYVAVTASEGRLSIVREDIDALPLKPDLAKKYGGGTPKAAEPPVAEAPKAAPPTKPLPAGVKASKPKKTASLASPIRELNSPTPGKRIDPDPIKGGKPKKVGEIALDLSKGVGRKLSFGGQSPRSQGTYYPGTAATVVKYAGDLDTTAHEIAHALDDQFGIVGDWAKPRAKSPFDAEIRKPEFQQTTRPSHSLTIKRAEGVAEWIRAWLVNPDAAEAAAPNFAKHFKDKVSPDVLKALDTFSGDVRTLAGADAKDQILANVRWEPEKGGLSGWLKEVRDPGGPGFQLNFWDRLQQRWQDSLKPYTKAVDYLKKERGTPNLQPSKDPEVLARLVAGATFKMDDIFANGMLDSKGNRIGKGFDSLVSDLEGKTAAALNEEMQDVAAYMIAQRTLEKQAQTGKSRVSGIGGGIVDEGSLAARRIRDVQADPEKFARVEKAAKAYRDWSDNVLQYLRDKGRISSKAYNEIKANNEYYVAMKRILEVGPEEEIVSFRGRGGKGLASHSDPIKKFKGSTRQIQNPYEALIEATYKAVKEADRNEVLQSFFDLAKPERGMYQGAVQDFASVARKANSSDKHNVVTVYRDGKQERWVIPDAGLYKAFKGITDNPTILPIWATLPAKVLRWGVTNFPTFAVRNKIRDVINTAIISDHSTNVWDMLKKKAPEVFEDFRKSGGGQFGTYMNDPKAYYGKMDEAVKEIAASRKGIVLNPGELAKKGAKGYRSLIEGAEVSTRLAEFEKAKKHAIDQLGYSEHDANLYAASKARDLMDFAVAGEFIKYINQVIPFTNASVQGMTRAIKSVRKNPASTAARWGMYVMVPIAAEKAWNSSQGHQKEYEQLPSYQKDLFWNFKVGPDMWLSVPKPFEFGVIGGLFGRGMDKALGDEKAFEGYGGSVADAVSPIGKTDLLGGPFGGLAGAAANYDFFRERPIVPPYEEDLALEHRKGTEKGSRLGQAIQDKFGFDARKVDHVFRQQFGYAGKYATEVSDLGREDKKDTLQILGELTGVLRPGPTSSARDVTWLGDYAHQHGISQRKEYKTLRELVSAYYDAKTQGAKARSGVDLRKYATELRAKWEQEKPTKDTPVPEKSKASDIPKGAPDIGKKIRSNLTPKLP